MPAIKDDAGIAKRTEGHRDRLPVHFVVDNFMPDQNIERVGSGSFALSIENDRRLFAELFGCFIDRLKGWIINRRDTIFRGTAGQNFFPFHTTFGEIGAPVADFKGGIFDFAFCALLWAPTP